MRLDVATHGTCPVSGYRLATVLALSLCGTVHAEQALQILHAEPLDVAMGEIAAARDSTARTSFQAHGRQFDLELESNARLLGTLAANEKAQLAAYELYRGRVTGANGSWVRLMRNGQRLQGMIWDGREMFVVEAASDVVAHLVTPLAASGDAPVIYRLADAQSGGMPGTCLVIDPGESPASPPASLARSYGKLVEELRVAAAAAATSQMEVAVVGDFEFYNRNMDAGATALSRMNVVDGMFSEQVGVRLVFPVIRFHDHAGDGLDQDDPTALINLFADQRNATADLRERGVAHLMTGRVLSGNTVGIAFRGSICHPRYGVSLSEGSLSFSSASLVIAHEIGHNFGAPHDIEPDSACSATGPGFVMSPRLSEGGDQFSPCSLAQMQPLLAAATCLGSLDVRDAAVNVEHPTRTASIGEPFELPIDVMAMGTQAVNGVMVVATLPATLSLVDASPSEAGCAAGAGNVTCTLGTLSGSTSRRIELTLRGNTAGTFASAVTLSASDDTNPGNNEVSVSLNLGTTPPPPPSDDGGKSESSQGGGGEIGVLTLFALFAQLGWAIGARAVQRARIRISSMGTGNPIAKPCA